MDLLEKFLRQNKIEFSLEEKVLEANSEDTSLFKIKPRVVVYPKNKFEISQLLAFLYESAGEPYHLTVRSAGTDMSGGALGQDIILSLTKYFKNIISLDQAKREVLVEPGVYYRDFEKATLKSNLLLPSYPASREICTVGGMVANNSGGEKSLVYGKTLDYVLELELVLANGEIVTWRAFSESELEAKLETLDKKSLEYKILEESFSLFERKDVQAIIKRNKPQVTKNSAGYYLWEILKEKKGEKVFDLTKLVTGSQGTLGVITRIKFSLIQPKKYSKMLLIFLKDLSALSLVRDLVLKAQPESFESYDDHTFKVVINFLPTFLKSIFQKNKAENKLSFFRFFKLILSFYKEAWMLLTYGMPKLFLIAEFTSNDEVELEKRVLECQKNLPSHLKNIKTRFIKTGFEAEKYWVMRRESFNLLRKEVKGLHTAPFIDDIIVKGEKLKEFLVALVPILEKYKLLYTIAGHVGDGNLHIIPLMNFTSQAKKSENIQTIKECSQEVYNLIHQFQGSITAEHNDGLIRTPFLFEMYDTEMLALFKQVKHLYDEKGIFSPGRKVKINRDWRAELDHNLKLVKFGRND